MMRRVRITAHVKIDKWETSLIKFCNHMPALDDEARHLERYGYEQLTVSSRLAIFKALCEIQFDCNLKLKENVRKSFVIKFFRFLTPITTMKCACPL